MTPELRTIQSVRPAVYEPPGQRKRARIQARTAGRPLARGKFLYLDGEKFFLRGVTYGPFRPDAEGSEYKSREDVDTDFRLMSESGINTVRTYTGVPGWLLDCAARYGLRVLVGIAWPQHITFLDSRTTVREIEKAVRRTVRAGAGHPAVLGYTVGNEIPASIVRWYGARRIERFIKGLYDIAKKEDPDALVTYVNYPTTEYLRLPFVDFVCFNVYLEEQASLSAYIGRLHNIGEGKPVVLGELGLDSCRNGAGMQAATLEWQIGRAFAGGCAGVCVFSWTDEWFRGGAEIEGWEFGVTDRDRNPKLALSRMSVAFGSVPFPRDVEWPLVTVVVCTYNGARHIRQTCEALEKVDYPNFEVIVVCDGSTDRTLEILRDFRFEVVALENGGLSRARNVGMERARGEIVAYLDDDAYPDEHWLKYLAWSFMNSSHAGVGGPNFPPLEGEFNAMCVAHSPGGPNHVLLSDEIAEHIPGCNMAFRRDALDRIGGFDKTFRIAGDDVDVCWRVQGSGRTIGFSPAAVVWHHRRNSILAYLRQQYNYGRAEAMLAKKWPRKFNSMGHVRWGGRIYGTGRARPAFPLRFSIYQGTWGSAAFQPIYHRQEGVVNSVTMMPEWHLVVAALGVIAMLGLVWPPAALASLAFIPAIGLQLVQSVRGAVEASLPSHLSVREAFRARLTIAALHYLQPLARLRGRIAEGLHPWKFSLVPLSFRGFRNPWFWHEHWASRDSRLEVLEARLHDAGARTTRGGDFDGWDLEVAGGLAGFARTLMAIEEHGGGRQLVRYRIEPRFSPLASGALAITGVLAVLLAVEHGLELLTIPVGVALLVSVTAVVQALSAAAAIRHAAEAAAKE